MTKTKRNFKKLVAFLTAFMVVLSCIPIYTQQGMRVSAQNDDGIEIRRFEVGFDEETAEKQPDGSYIWTAATTAPGHKFIYYLDFELSGKEFFDPGEIEIIVPKRLLKNRADEYADQIELSVPAKAEVENYDGELKNGDNEFEYEIIGDNVVITNYRKFSTANGGYIELGYITTQTSFEYQDMKISEDFTAEIRLLDGNNHNNVIDSAGDSERGIGLNTAVVLSGTEKRSLNTVNAYSYWQTRWGAKPENADNYYFVVWEIKTYVGYCTQPFDITIDDYLTQGEGEPVAYRFSGESEFTADNARYNIRNDNYSNSYRIDYVITKHPKSVYSPLSSYTIKNRETVTLHPVDGVDDDKSLTAGADFYHFTPAPLPFTAPGDYVNIEKRGNSNWWTPWPVADYGLQDLKDGIVDHLSGNIRFWVGTSTYLYSYTRTPDTDPQNIENYGKRKVNVTFTDELLYLNDNIKITDGKAVIGADERLLTYEDIELEYITYSVGMKDGERDEVHNTIVGTTVTYQPDDILTFYGKFNGGDWVQIGQYDLYRGRTINIDSNYVERMTSSEVVFKRGCTAYRITASNAHYSTEISSSPYYRINNSDYVLAQSEGINKIKLTDISNLTVTDDSGSVVYDRDSMAHDYILGVQKESKIAKDVAFTTSDPLHREATIGWRVYINEHYMTNDGIVYVPQEEGVFYDLLPIGTMIDLNSVTIGIDYSDDLRSITYLDDNDFEVSKTDNYKNTGRTLLIVRIKTQFSKAMLLYNTLYTWDASMDYGTNLLNTIAYETGNDRLGGGYPDNGGEIGDKDVMSGLDPDRSGNLFIYEQKRHSVRFLVSTRTGLTKSVNDSKTTDFSDEAYVRQSSEYVYQLRYSTNANSRAKNIVIYDSLENYSDDEVSSDWHGKLLKDSTRDPVEIEQPEGKGIVPVIYYSDVENLNIERYHNVDSDRINNKKVWKTEEEFGDVTRARAVAIDLRKDEDGNDYVLNKKSSIVVKLYMLSPDEDTTGKEDPIACNNVYLYDTVIDINNIERPYDIHHDFTKVHFKIMGDVRIHKVDSSDNTVSVKGISFKLTGTSAYGREYGNDNKDILTTDKYGRLTFTDIEKGSYTLSECTGSPDYLPIGYDIPVEIDEQGRTRINGVLQDDGEYYDVSNEPRVHADVEFYKRDLLSTEKVIPGTQFILQGTSYYYSDKVDEVIFTRTADENGRVLFENIEWGSYTLKEIDTPAEYALSKTVYNVRVDKDGHAFIEVSKTEGDGDENSLKKANGIYSIYNEPLHSFTIQKESSTTGNPVRAVFRLTNQSTGVYVEKTTQSNGQLIFDELFSGEYWLEETEVLDENYNLDDTQYFVSIDKHGNVQIDGLSQNDEGRFVITNSPDGTVTVIKRWDDNETTDSRLEKGIVPVIHISSDVSENAAYFDANLNAVKAKGSLKSFSHFTGDDSVAMDKIQSGDAVKVDDGKTRYFIYAWDNTGSGDIVWYSNAKTVYLTDTSREMLNNCSNITSIDMSGINTFLMQNMSEMFMGDSKLVNLNIKSMDTSWAKNMANMFKGCKALQKITLGDGQEGVKDKFDTSQVTEMNGMFYDCPALKKIEFGNSFKTSRVRTMRYMFKGCNSLENIMGDEEDTTGLDVSGFDTSSVTEMQGMFTYCGKLEFIDVSGWDTSEVVEMYEMFSDCTKLANKYGADGSRERTGLDLSHFNTEHVKSMRSMFYNCQSLQFIDLESFDVSNVREMQCMFRSANKLKSLDLSSFEPTCVTDMHEMFYVCSALESIDFGSKFDVRSVLNMQDMFNGCTKLQRFEPGAAFVTSRVTNMQSMFRNCNNLEYVDLSSFDTGHVLDFSYMFSNCWSLINNNEVTNLDVSCLDTSSATTMQEMFRNCNKLQYLDVSGFNTRMLKTPTSMFKDCTALKELDLTSWRTDSMDTMSQMFNNCTALETVTFGQNFKADRVTSMWECFNQCTSLTSLDLSMFTPISLGGLQETFAGCSSLERLMIPNFSCRASTRSMFGGCTAITDIDIRNLRLTGDCSYMFSGCSNLVNLNISNIETDGMTATVQMFNNCSKLTSLDLRRFDMSYVNDINNMFAECKNLKSVDLRGWDTGYVSSMSSLFSNCQKLTTIEGIENLNTESATTLPSFGNCYELTSLDLSGWDTSKVTTFSRMFQNCSKLEKIYVSDLWKCSLDNWYTFSGCSKLVGGQGTSCSETASMDGENYHKARYAIIDDASNGNPGYLTRKPGTPHIDPPADGVYFRNDPIGSVITNDPNRSTYFSGVTSFKHFTGNEADVDKTYHLDDERNAYHIYGWVNSADKTFYWWADTENVYLTNGSKNLFNRYSNYTSIDTDGINTSQVTDFSSMFYQCYSLRSLTTEKMDVSNAVTMASMFQSCSRITSLDLSGWNTSKVRNMGSMFRYCYALADLRFANEDGTTLFDTSNVRTMEYMFSDAAALTELDVSMFRTHNVIYMQHMFSGYNQGIELTNITFNKPDGTTTFVTSKVMNMNNMFRGCYKITRLDLSKFNTAKVTNMSYMFKNCYALTELDVSNFDTRNVTDMSYMFGGTDQNSRMALQRIVFKKEGEENTFITSKVLNMAYMFVYCSALTELDLSNFDTSLVNDMQYMFGYDYGLTSIKFGDGFDTSRVQNMKAMFWKCSNIKNTSSDTYCDFNRLKTSMVINMQSMFESCSGLQYIDVRSWDVSKVTNMASMFKWCGGAREITFTHWDASSVTNMNEMFYACRYLGDDDTDQKVLDLSDFKVSSLLTMINMFRACERLRNIRFANDDGTTRFDSSMVEDIKDLFHDCTRLVSADLSGLDTSRAVYMNSIFRTCTALTDAKFIRNDGTTAINMKRLQNLSYAFDGCTNLPTVDLRAFNTENVTNMQGLFYNCCGLTGVLDVSALDTSRVTDMSHMFSLARADDDANYLPDKNLTGIKFKDDEGNTGFVTSRVTTMVGMFFNRNGLEGLDLSGFDFSRVINIQEAFSNCTGLKELIINDNADFSQVQNMSNTFNSIGKVEKVGDDVKVWLEELDMSNWDLSSVTTMAGMFRGANFKGLNFGEDTKSVRNINANTMFYNCDYIETLDLSGLNTEHVTTMSEMFIYSNNMENILFAKPDGTTVFNTSKVTTMYRMFRDCNVLEELDLSCFDTYNVTSMREMFYNCSKLKSIEFGRLFTAEKVTTMQDMFNGCTELSELDLSGFHTGKVTNMEGVFWDCHALKQLDLSGFDTSRVTTMYGMFSNCRNLKELDLSGFDTGKVKNMRDMFNYCGRLQKINFVKEDGTCSFDTSKVTNMNCMFGRIGSVPDETFELDLSCFDTSSVTDMAGMFTMRYATGSNKLIKIWVSDKWTTENVTSGGEMFWGASNLKGKEGTTYRWSNDDVKYAVIDDPDNDSPGYLSKKAAPEMVQGTAAPGTETTPVTAAVGVSYVSTDGDTVCKIEYRTDEIWVYTFYGIDNSVEYYAWEDFLENYSSDHMGQSRAIEVNKTEYSEILNTTTIDPPTYGSLYISKVLAAAEGAEITRIDEERQFVFTVTLKDQNGDPLTGAARFGGVGFVNGVATVTLRGGEELVMDKIPSGYYYKVEEEEYDNFTTTYTGAPEGVIIADEVAEVEFTNTKIPVDEESASFKLTKSVKGHYEDDSDAYTFVVELKGLHKNEEYTTGAGTSFKTDATGHASVNIYLKNGMSDTFTVPHGAEFRITESGGAKYTSSYVITDSDDNQMGYDLTTAVNTSLRTSWIKADKDKLITVDYTNTRNIRQNLTLTKEVVGGSTNNTDTFEFTVILKGLDPGERVRTSIGNEKADSNGTLKMENIALTSGSRVIFYDLPVKSTYQITEAKSDYIASYALTDEGGVSNFVSAQAENQAVKTKLSTAVETVNEGEEVTVTFTNTRVTHDIQVKKALDMTDSVIPEGVYLRKEFKFIVELEGLTEEEYTVDCNNGYRHDETITAVDGAAHYEIYLKDGQDFTIKDLNENATYTIKEEAVKNYIASYEVTTNDTAVVVKRSDRTAAPNADLATAKETIDPTDLQVVFSFKNTYNVSDYVLPAAGMPDKRPLTVSLISGMLLFAAAYLFIQRRRKNTGKTI